MPESLEAQLSYKLAEYSENRSITSVLPVDNPLATDEPELLEMSPEEAEGTQLCDDLFYFCHCMGLECCQIACLYIICAGKAPFRRTISDILAVTGSWQKLREKLVRLH